MCLYSLGEEIGKMALVRGWYGYRNIGDEAMLHVLIGKLQHEGYRVVVSSREPEYTRRIHQVEAVPSGVNGRFFRALLTADMLVEGPGNKHGFLSIIGQGVPFLAKALGKEVRYIAVGLSPHVWKYDPLHDRPQVVRFSNPLLRWVVRLLFDQVVDYISLRSIGSVQLLKANGVQTDIQLAYDLAYELQYPSKSEIRPILQGKCGIDVMARPTVGVTLRRFVSEEHNQAFAEKIAGVINRALSAWDGQFLFVGFAKYGEDDDAIFAGHILQQVEERYRGRVFVLDEERPDIVKGAIGSCVLVIGVRYHAQVFADSCHVPFVAIVYDPKSEEVAQRSVLRFDIDNIDVNKIVAQIMRLGSVQWHQEG